MAAPFGFSVGDFIAAIELIAKVAEAVQDSSGAASQYQSLTRDLANLQAALLKVESLQNGNNSPIVGTVYDQTSLTRQSAQELLDGISKFEKKLGEQAKKGWKYSTGRKMQWAILQSKEVSKARSVIYEQVRNLSMLNLLQILEMVQKLDESQQDMSRTITEKIEVSKSEITNKITRLSTAQDTHDKTMINTLKSSLDEFHLSMRTGSQPNTAQIKLLGDVIQDVQDRITLSSNQSQDTVKQEGQSHRAELSRFFEGIDAMRNTISKQSESSTRGLQLATNDIKDTILSVAETTRESHAKLVQDATQGLEAKITSNFEFALAQFERPKLQMIRQTQNFDEIGNKVDGKAVPEELLTPSSGEASVTGAFFADCLAKILQVLYSALRRMQLSLIWFLPLVAEFLAHLARNIPRQLPRLLENSIRFEDALGRVNLLPYEYFQYWEVFQSMLRCNFKGLPGESNVNAGLYFILRSRRPDQLITQKVWKRSVLPGANINMSILLAGINSSHGTCPRCKSRSTPKATTVKCQECDLEYHSSNMADLEKRQDEIAQRFLKLMGLDKIHDSSEPDGDIDATLERSSGKAKSASRKTSQDSYDDDDSETEPNTIATQIRVKNNAQDIEVFKRIHTLIEEEEIAHPDRNGHEKIWNTTSQEERERIKGFWLSLRTEEKTALIKVEKGAVLKKMKEQQKHSCSCTVCTWKRTSIEKELELLYDAYYEELEQYASAQQGSDHHGITGANSGSRVPQHFSYEAKDEKYFTSEEEYDRNHVVNGNGNTTKKQAEDFFKFGNSLTVKGGILTVADDLLKNDGSKFIEMMEQLAERRMARESIAKEEAKDAKDDYDSEESYDSQEEDYYEEEMDSMTEEQRMDEGRRMFQIFAARMFEQRVLVAYKEKVGRERQQGSL